MKGDWESVHGLPLRRLALCQTCREQSICGVWSGRKRCESVALLRRPLMCCPLDPPRWWPEASQKGA